jgi:hypothetical protein
MLTITPHIDDIHPSPEEIPSVAEMHGKSVSALLSSTKEEKMETINQYLLRIYIPVSFCKQFNMIFSLSIALEESEAGSLTLPKAGWCLPRVQ